jgi:hypothetical protein
MGREAPTAKELLEKAVAKGYIINNIPKYIQKILKRSKLGISP